MYRLPYLIDSMFRISIFLILFAAIPCSSLICQEFKVLDESFLGWEKVKDKNGFLVLVKESDTTEIKSIRVIFEFEATLESTVEVLSDIDNYTEWIYKAKKANLIDTINSFQYYYYINFDMPFPVWDRDNVILTSIFIDEENRIVLFDSVAAPNYIPESKGIIRVKTLESHWKIEEKEDGLIRIDYNGFADPSGSLPSWLANLALTAGPTKSFEGFKSRVNALDKQKLEGL